MYQPGLNATSFVIASADARRCIEETFDAEYTYLEPGALSETWWVDAIDTGLLTIGNHSWDHLHPALAQVAHSTQARADFAKVESFEDADAQIAAAGRRIGEITRGGASPYFAYPFGHYNRFLTDTYLPGRVAQTGVCAALSTTPEPVTRDSSIWCLPRFVCGHDWRSPEELTAILSQ